MKDRKIVKKDCKKRLRKKGCERKIEKVSLGRKDWEKQTVKERL